MLARLGNKYKYMNNYVTTTRTTTRTITENES